MIMFPKYFSSKFFLVLLIFASHALAQRNQLFVGARPAAMGEAFAAIADDGNAAYWNPAGMAFSLHREFNSSYNNAYGLDFHNGFVSLLAPLGPGKAVGGYWLYDGFKDDEFDYSSNMLVFSSAFALNRHLALGVNLKYLTFNVDLDNRDVFANAEGFGVDAGALFTASFKRNRLLKRAQAGVMAHDFTNTKLKYENGSSNTIYRRNLRFGASAVLFEEVVLSRLKISEPLLTFDSDDRWHAGAEVWLNQRLALRGGLQNDWEKKEGALLSWGAGLRWQGVQFDYAYVDPPTLGSTHRFSVSLRSEQNPRWVTIEEANIESLFASLYRAYVDTVKIGDAVLRNLSEDTLKVTVSMQVKKYMSTPTEWEVKLPPRADYPLRLHANFNEEMLTIDGRGKALQARLKVRYAYKDGAPTESKSARFFVHGAGAIAWDDPGRAAAYVTQQDPCVRAFAEKVNAAAPSGLEENWLSTRSEAVRKAIMIYAALRSLDIQYLADANRDLRTIDTILYPKLLLNGIRRAGDCDDLTVLYVSLLESCGVETAFLSAPGHFFMMLNTGLRANRPVPFPDEYFVQRGNQLWMPLEATYLANDSTFCAAWLRGANEYQDYFKTGAVRAYLVTEQQRRYPPADFMEEAPCQTPATYAASLRSLSKENERFNQTAQAQFARLYAQQAPNDFALRNRIGLAWALLGEAEKAETEFDLILARDPAYAPALNNLANLRFLENQPAAADSLYQRALQQDTYHSGIFLNRALLAQTRRALAIDTSAARRYQTLSDQMLTEVFRRLEADSARLGEVWDYLEPEDSNKAGLPETLKREMRRVKTFIDRALRQRMKQKFVKDAVWDRAGSGKGNELLAAEEEALLWWSK